MKYLSDIGTYTKAILFMRHAERYEINDMRTSHKVLLTEQGKEDARDLGTSLAGKTDKIRFFHSPVPRCRQTAECVIRGFSENGGNADLEGSLSWLSGDFIRADQEYISRYVTEHGSEVFLRHWFDGVIPAETITPLEEAAEHEMKFLLEQLDTAEGLVVDITHDWDMSLLIEHYLGLRHEKVGIPGFLEYVILYTRDGKTGLRFRDFSCVI